MDKVRGEYHDIPSKSLCLTGPKNFVVEPSCVSDFFKYRKTLCLRGVYHAFLWKNCCITVQKIFVEEPVSVSVISDSDKTYAREGNFTIFCRTFGLKVWKNFVG